MNHTKTNELDIFIGIRTLTVCTQDAGQDKPATGLFSSRKRGVTLVHVDGPKQLTGTVRV